MSIKNLKGSNLTVGNIVSVKISNEHHAATEIFGQITGIQEWNSETIAIQIQGISDWIRLNDNTEVGLA
jgi:hypothetical protein